MTELLRSRNTSAKIILRWRTVYKNGVKIQTGAEFVGVDVVAVVTARSITFVFTAHDA